MSEPKATIECKLCGYRVTVPSNHGALTIRCPSCGNVSTWRPQSESATSTLLTDVREIHFCCANTGDEFSVVFARASAAQKFRIQSIKPPKHPSAVKAGALRHQHLNAFDAHDFDVSGWHCTGCGHGSSNVPTLFVKCPVCRRLVCGAKVISIQNGGQTFECTPDCGHSGAIAGEIATYEAAAENSDRKKNFQARSVRIEAHPTRPNDRRIPSL